VAATITKRARKRERSVTSRKRDEPVRLTRIYTRGGDAGETSLGDGSRVSKLHPLVRAYGAVDELNSVLGWTRLEAQGDGLERIQNELFDLGADLSVPFAADDGKLRVTQDSIDRLERDCDEANAPLPQLRSFVLPGGTEAAARLHIARATCRRAEREVLACALETEINPLAAVYLNRLSDLLFILARAANGSGEEPLWTPGGDR
jgi:cob(I)alamin adenosyltransferase